MSIEAMKQALEALEQWNTPMYKRGVSITSLRQAIAEAEKQNDDVYIMGNYVGKGKVSSVTLGGVSFTGNGTAGREADVQPTGFFFQMPKQEPVAWYWRRTYADGGYTDGVERQKGVAEERVYGNAEATVEPLYTAPPQREWQGLTIDEVEASASLGIYAKPLIEFARAIEAKLKEKNYDKR